MVLRVQLWGDIGAAMHQRSSARTMSSWGLDCGILRGLVVSEELIGRDMKPRKQLSTATVKEK